MTETAEWVHPLLRYPCTTCGAAVGDRCRAKSGRTTDAHAARYEAEGDYYRAACGVEGHTHLRAYCPDPNPA